MATIDLVKRGLKSTTKMSLNERFQLLKQNQIRRQTNPQNTNKMVHQNNANRLELRQGSQRNRRLALQMANRPSVLAALKSPNNPNNRPVKQRLGINRFNNQTNALNVNRNPNRNRINRSNFSPNTVNRNRNVNQNRKNNQNIGVVVGVRRKGLQRNRLRRTQTFKTNPTVGVFKPKRRIGPQIRNQNQNRNQSRNQNQIRNQNQMKAGNKKKFRINRNFNAGNDPGKQQNPQKKRFVKPNKQQLDSDLDAYMSGTKTHLDAELDAYMSETI